MEGRSYRLPICHSGNEFKAHRQNRTEQCKLAARRYEIDREKVVFQKDFRMKACRLKARRTMMVNKGQAGQEKDDPRRFSKSMSEPGNIVHVSGRTRSACVSSSRLSRKEECLMCDQISNLVMSYGSKSNSTNVSEPFSAKQLISSIETTVRPLTRHRTPMDVTKDERKSEREIQMCGNLYLTRDEGADDAVFCSDFADDTYDRRLVREASMMLPPDETGHVCSALTSARHRKTFPAKIELQRRIGEFVQTQEEFNRENPVDKEVVVQCEQVRLRDVSKSTVDNVKGEYFSKREAMIAEVLEKLCLTEEDRWNLPTK